MKVRSFLFFLVLFCLSACGDGHVPSSQWQGVWEYNRYVTSMGGTLEISDCQNKSCVFHIQTYNGAHLCEIEGTMTVVGDKASYVEEADPNLNTLSESARVSFKLDNHKKIITVTGNDAIRYYCGLQGYFEGEYEYQDNPLRYKTSFNCWRKRLSDAEKTICASDRLARADREVAEKYDEVRSKDWYKQRNACGADEECLWKFYVKSVKNEYLSRHEGSFNLYDYMGDIRDDDMYYPSDFVLLDDVLRHSMEVDDYEKWVASFAQISLDNYECENCHFRQYGVAGLYTIMESVFYIDKNQLWLAFIDSEKERLTVYGPQGKGSKDIPQKVMAWIERLESYYPQGYKLKYFSF